MRLDGADIVTGSAHAALGFWLADTGLLEAGDGPARFVGEQGDGLGRPARLLVEVARDGGRPTRVRIPLETGIAKSLAEA